MTNVVSTAELTVSIERRPDTLEAHMLFDLHFLLQDGLSPGPLAACIEKRVVQCRLMSMRPLSDDPKLPLAKSLTEDYSVIGYEGQTQRRRLIKFLFGNTRVRLTTPEAYVVHKSVIGWGARLSEDKIPNQAVDVDPLTAHFMRWMMQSWGRVDLFNKWVWDTFHRDCNWTWRPACLVPLTLPSPHRRRSRVSKTMSLRDEACSVSG